MKPGRVQKALNIQKEGNYIVSVKNPEKRQPDDPGLSEDHQAKLSQKLQKKFQDRRFVPLEPDFLNTENAELILIGVNKQAGKELGIDLQKEVSAGEADLMKDLALDKEEHPVKPLFEGEWK